MTKDQPQRRLERVRHALKVRQLEVVATERISPGFIRVRFASDALHDFVSASFDDHLKLMLPAGADTPLVLPVAGVDGIAYPDGATRPVMRDYTPRRFDTAAGLLDIEFALHGDGPAAAWAAQAAPGQHVGIGGPRGSMVIPMDYDWHLLVGDDTALPAIARRLEELPAGSQVIAVIEVAAGDRREFDTRCDLQLHWLTPGAVKDGEATEAAEVIEAIGANEATVPSSGSDATAESSALPGAVRTLSLPRGEGFAWAAGESATIQAVRRILIEHHQLDRNQVKAAAYWKRGSIAHHENLE